MYYTRFYTGDRCRIAACGTACGDVPLELTCATWAAPVRVPGLRLLGCTIYLHRVIALLGIWLLVNEQLAVAQLSLYVAPVALGDGSGTSAANASQYVSTEFWDGVNNSLADESVSVTFLDGEYISHNLVLRNFGHSDHELTLQSQSSANAVFGSDKFIELRGVQNVAVRDFGFTGGNPAGSARKLHVTSSDNTANGMPSKNVLIAGNKFYDAPTHYGGIGITHLASFVTVYDNYFRNVGSRSGSHLIYNSYDVNHIKVIGNHFEDSPGDYVRFRDNSDFGEVRNNTFVSTGDDFNLIFVRIAVFNDVNPGDEFHASNYLIRDNSFTFHPGRDQDAVGFTSTGYEPVGLNFLPSAADSLVLKFGKIEEKRQLFLDTMGIDMSKVRIYNNTYANENREFIYWARVDFGASSQGWTGRADITGTENAAYLGIGDIHSNAMFDSMDVDLFLRAIEASDEMDFLLRNDVWFGDYAAADFNGDSAVDLDDVQLFLDFFTGLVPDTDLEPVRALLNTAPPDGNGDFNSDGAVDAADYVVWRKYDGLQEEYDEWRASFGSSSANSMVAAREQPFGTVPEPIALMLLLTSAVVGCVLCRRTSIRPSCNEMRPNHPSSRSLAATCGNSEKSHPPLRVWRRMLFGWTVILAGLASTAAAEYPPRYPDRTNLLVYINEDGSETPITTLEQWEKRREHILQNMTKVFGELPDESKRCDLDVQVLEVVETPLYVRKKITYRPLLGCRVPAYLFIPRQVEGKRPAVLCLHPSGKFGIREPAGIEGRSPNTYHHAKDLAELGFVTLAPAYHATTESGEPYSPYKNGYGSWMGGFAVWNHMRAIDLLQSLEEVDPEKIGAIGHSLGCLNTLILAALDQRVKVSACSAGVTSFEKHKTARDSSGKLTVWNQYDYFPRIESDFDRDASKVPFDFPEVLGAIAPRPIIISAPLGDYMNPIAALDCVTAAVPVYQLYRSPRSISLILPPGGHALPVWIQGEMYAFISRELDLKK